MAKKEITYDFGNSLFVRDLEGPMLDSCKNRLDLYYQKCKKKYELDAENIWCKFHEYKLIIKPSSKLDPLNRTATISIKWSVSGRAFYMMRNFKLKKKAVRYLNNKSVPKRKRNKIYKYIIERSSTLIMS